MTVVEKLAEEAEPKSRKRADRERFRPSTLLWLTPATAILAGLFLVPIGYAIYLGFTNLQLLGPHAQSYNFTGLSNFDRMVHDAQFWSSVRLTLIFVIASGIIAQTFFGMALALLAQRAFAAIRMSVGAIVIMAWVLPEIACAFLWYSFSQSGGLLSHLIGRPGDDLLSTAPFLIVCLANVWRGTAFSMLILSAGLRAVPAEVDEAAQLEGASYLRRLFRVTLPIIRPTILVNMLLITIGTIGDFTLIYAMTQGGPGTSTSILPVFMYIEAFTYNALGYGTAIALALMVIGFLISVVYIHQLRPELRRGQ